MLASRILCRPLAYAAIATGAVWTVSVAADTFGTTTDTPDAESLRTASSVLIGGLLLAAFAHWDESADGEAFDNSGDSQ